MREQVTFDLDSEVKIRLDEWAKQYGLEEDEAIRYILGNYLPAGFRTYPSPLPSGSFRLSSPLKMEDEPAEDPYLKMMARMIETLHLQCPECLEKLKAEDILVGECSKCGSKI